MSDLNKLVEDLRVSAVSMLEIDDLNFETLREVFSKEFSEAADAIEKLQQTNIEVYSDPEVLRGFLKFSNETQKAMVGDTNAATTSDVTETEQGQT